MELARRRGDRGGKASGAGTDLVGEEDAVPCARPAEKHEEYAADAQDAHHRAEPKVAGTLLLDVAAVATTMLADRHHRDLCAHTPGDNPGDKMRVWRRNPRGLSRQTSWTQRANSVEPYLLGYRPPAGTGAVLACTSAQAVPDVT